MKFTLEALSLTAEREQQLDVNFTSNSATENYTTNRKTKYYTDER